MSTDNSPQTQSISISNSQIAGQIGQSAQGLAQTQVNQPISEEQLTSLDVLELILQIQELIKNSSLEKTNKETLSKYLDTAREEVCQKEPDKNFVARSLQRIAEVLKGTNETVDTGQQLWDRLQSIINQLLPWLGVAKSFFGL